MPGPVLLQGGGELAPGCRTMDLALLALAPGPVLVLPLASAPGRDHDRTLARATSYYRDLGAEVLSPSSEIAEASVVVLTGGSPSRLREALVGTAVGAALVRHVAEGGAVSGASAGAMLLGSWTVLPEEGLRVDTGLGIAEGLVVVPHWHGARDDWLAAIDRGIVVGIPEESGLLLQTGRAVSVGRRAVRFVLEEVDLGVGATRGLPSVG